MEDALLDVLLSKLTAEHVISLETEELEKEIKVLVWTWLDETTSAKSSGIVQRLTLRVLMFYKSYKSTSVRQLEELLRDTVITPKEIDAPIVSVNHVTEEGKKVTKIVLRIPNLSETSEDDMNRLSMVIDLLALTTNTSVDNIHLLKDESLGSEIKFSSTILKHYGYFRAFLRTPSAGFPGDRYVIKSRFTGTLADLLGAIRLLRRHISFLRKSPKKDPKEKDAISIEELMAKFNSTFGLDDKRTNTWLRKCTKQIFNEAVRNTDYFPPQIIAKVKESNGVNSAEALFHKMGYTPKVPNSLKLREVILSRPVVIPAKEREPEKSGVFRIKPDGDLTRTTGPEIHAAVLMTLPRIDTADSSKSPDQQMTVKPLTANGLRVADSFSALVPECDALDKAYAFLTSSKLKKSETTITHYKNARGHFLNLCSLKKVYKDSKGTNFSHLKDIPSNSRDFLCKSFHHVYSEKKRSADEMEVDQTEPVPEKKDKATTLANKQKKVEKERQLVNRRSERLAATAPAQKKAVKKPKTK
jgi:hypothetical protein